MTAEGRMVTLNPIPMESFADHGQPVVRLSGREYAAMATGRVLRAAQAHFEYPVPRGDGVSRAGRANIGEADLAASMERKRFAVFEDGESRLLRMLYRELVLRFRADTRRAQQQPGNGFRAVDVHCDRGCVHRGATSIRLTLLDRGTARSGFRRGAQTSPWSGCGKSSGS